jgi:hypothetical protein
LYWPEPFLRIFSGALAAVVVVPTRGSAAAAELPPPLPL